MKGGALELRTPEILRLRWLALLVQGCSAGAGVLLGILYGRMRSSRQLVADPEWPNKVQSGQTDSIRYCVYCNSKCVASIMSGQPVSCILWDNANETKEVNA